MEQLTRTQAVVAAGAMELDAAILQIAVTLCLAGLFAVLFRRYRKPYLAWFAVAWSLYLLRLVAITTFLVTGDWLWLYWHQVTTGWTALGLLWAALVFSRAPRWRWRYLALMLFPPVWSYVAIYRMNNFLLAAGPAVLFLAGVTLGTGWVFVRYYRQVRSGGAALLGGALLLWGLHHLDYPFLRARGAWSPWGYYLDILFLLATGAGILVLLLDDLRRGLTALLTLSGDLQREPGDDGIDRLLERPLSLPAVRGSALYVREADGIRLLRGAGACAGWSAVPDGEEAATIGEVVVAGAPRFVAHWRTPGNGAARTYAFAAVLPIFPSGGATTALVIVSDARDPFAALDTGYLVALGQQIGAALNSLDLYRRLAARTEDLERLSRRMVEQHERERRRLSLHLHDETAQLMTAVKLQLGVLQERAEPEMQRQLGRALALMDEGIGGIRHLTNDLRPSLLDDLGLVPALRSMASAYAERSGIAVAVDAPESLPPLVADAELALFRALQESLSNVAEHAQAHRVAVGVRAEAGRVVMDIADDGVGFPADGAPAGLERAGHLGLTGMRERIIAVGGTIETGAADGGGARVTVRVPVAAA